MEHFPNLILNISDIQNIKRSYAIVVLNQPISVDKDLVVSLWNHCEIRLKFIK